MLVIERGLNESIVIDDVTTIKIIKVKGERVRLLCSAPPEVTINREEIHRKLESEGIKSINRKKNNKV